MRQLYYFAYGSNLHPVRLTQRAPSAQLVGVATRPGHRLVFHKKSTDGSGKCNMFGSGDASDVVYGALYRLDPEQKKALDRFEGNGYGYRDNRIVLARGGKDYTGFTYLAQQSHIVDSLPPYHWYKALVVLGARYLGFPAHYIAAIEAVCSVEDPDRERRAEQARLIERLIGYGQSGR